MDNAMYDIALRNKIRFASVKGLLTLEQLWDVPLRSRDEFDLDTVAKGVNRALKAMSEESFVATRRSLKQTFAETALELVKHVIAIKLDEEEKAGKRADRIKEREKLLDALEKKQDGKLDEMTEDDIKKRLGELDEE